MTGLGGLGSGRNFASGYEPGFFDRVAQRFADIPLPPDSLLLALALLAPMAIAGVATARIRHRRRRADEGVRRRAEDGVRSLTALRHARMAHAEDVRRLDVD